ncbi:BCD family MFS transporter [Rhabdaerophilum sp. SD176]|uniref:BCD family MFS transporter n=1 Tax=Rhabdaerophilum sp. SD176 TaxID=2983548 RepID=UPI0024DF7C82|nr:BCD family MFS transporter [Rhabdaerophilum sp. SD176]
MINLNRLILERLKRIDTRYLPFADAATPELPLGRLMRLALFQVSVGMATVLLLGTLNRVMIVELGVSASLVAVMVAIPFLAAPFRALVGFRSDTHRSAFGLRRVPYVWTGTLLQFSGLAIMPFAVLLLGTDHNAPAWVGQVAAALAFLLAGTGLHTTQTAGLALATDLAAEDQRPRVVALMYVVFLIGTIVSGYVFSLFLADFSPVRLIQVVQGAAVATFILNVVALWKQEVRRAPPPRTETKPSFREAWALFAANRQARRFLVAVGFGTAGFNMQDIILEPYGAEVLGLSVSATTMLTALLGAGSLLAFALAARWLALGLHPCRLAAIGVLAGLVAFPMVIFAGALQSPILFQAGVCLIGFGAGLFAVSTLMAAMSLETGGLTGLALGAWGAVQASCAGLAIAVGGIVRDSIAMLGKAGSLGAAFTSPSAAYGFVYHIEILLLFSTLVALGPLVRTRFSREERSSTRLRLAEFPS